MSEQSRRKGVEAAAKDKVILKQSRDSRRKEGERGKEKGDVANR